MNDVRVHAVILAGGNGERLWPLSRKTHPKQTLPFLQESSLLEQTIERIASYIPEQRRWVLTSAEHEEHILEKVGNKIAGTIVEPEARNTGPAMLLAALLIQQSDPEAVLLFLPSDHYIPQKNLFLEFIEHGIDYVAEHQKITLFGLRPTHAATSYGYIEYTETGTFPTTVSLFHEKPTEELAEYYCENGYLWNSGIVAVRAQTLIDSIKKVAPEMYDAVSDYVQGCGDYADAKSISIDHGLLEKSNQITVLPVDFIWHDIANLETFLSLRNTFNNEDNIIQIDAKDNLIEAEDTLVAVVGVDNLCVIKKDDILLIVHRDQVEKVKQIIDTLKKGHKEEYL